MNYLIPTTERTAVADALKLPAPRRIGGSGTRRADLPRDARAQPRLGTAMAAMVRSERGEKSACIRNLSRRGLMISMESPPKRGEFVEVVARNRSLIGQVKWSDASHAGLALRDAIDVNALLSGESGPVAAHRMVVRKAVSAKASANLYPRAHIIARQLQFAAMIAFGVFSALMIAFTVNDLLIDVVNQIKTGLPG